MEITVITPIASYHRYREDAVRELVRAQSVPCEHIVIVDHDRRGAGWARNQGLSRVITPFVVFLDADDEISSRFAEACLSEYTLRERAGRARYIYTDWYEGDRYVPAPNCAWVDKTYHVVTTLLPTAWARAVGGFDETLSGAEDTALYIKLNTSGYCGARLNSPLFRYVGGGKRSTAFAKSPDYADTMRHIIDTYGGKMSCCGETTILPSIPGNSPEPGDVLVMAKWGGNRVEFGRVTGRRYPRGGSGSLMYVAQADVKQSPNLWEVVSQPAAQTAVVPEVARVGALFGSPPPRIIDPTFQAQAVAPDLSAVLKRWNRRTPSVDFPSGQTIDGWNLDAWTMTIALEHMPKSGKVLTVGAGNIGFYGVEFAKLGYATTILEPNPQPELYTAMHDTSAVLISAALDSASGKATFYVNDTDVNVSSTSRTHWGVYSYHEMTVDTLSYADVLKRMKAKTLACLQLDIEGNEPDILPFVAENPPSVLVYEYGGGDLKKRRTANWSPGYVEKASRAFELLRPHYTHGAVVDPTRKTVHKFALSDIPVGGYDGLFHEDSGFGNVVLWN